MSTLGSIFRKEMEVGTRPRSMRWNTLPYLASCLFNCAAGDFDPLGLSLFLMSTVPGMFRGSPGLLCGIDLSH